MRLARATDSVRLTRKTPWGHSRDVHGVLFSTPSWRLRGAAVQDSGIGEPARLSQQDAVEDIVQETLLRLMLAGDRVSDRTRVAYATVIAKNLLSSMWHRRDVRERHEHRMLDDDGGHSPEDEAVRAEE